jgi:DNA-binding transcriptional ArsR family regulator
MDHNTTKRSAAEALDAVIADAEAMVADLKAVRAGLVDGHDPRVPAKPRPALTVVPRLDPVPLSTGTRPDAEGPAPNYQDDLLELLIQVHGQHLSPSALGSALGISQPFVSNLLNSLESEGLIRREGATRNRVVYVTALEEEADTDAGNQASEDHLETAPLCADDMPAPDPNDPLAPPLLPSQTRC